VLGLTSPYHDILPAVKRVEIGWTWYANPTAQSRQHHLQTAAVNHAFETLDCHVVGWQTDNSTSRRNKPSSG
jgi:RimJ/RimL family protein N-acetyltransferase